jgi:hypothetical protein
MRETREEGVTCAMHVVVVAVVVVMMIKER